jgi:hypothetical protein
MEKRSFNSGLSPYDSIVSFIHPERYTGAFSNGQIIIRISDRARLTFWI